MKRSPTLQHNHSFYPFRGGPGRWAAPHRHPRGHPKQLPGASLTPAKTEQRKKKKRYFQYLNQRKSVTECFLTVVGAGTCLPGTSILQRWQGQAGTRVLLLYYLFFLVAFLFFFLINGFV